MENFEEAKQFFLDGLRSLENTDYQEAEASLLKSLELIPDRVSTLTNLSAAQIKLKKYNEAKDSARKAIALDSTSSEAWLNLGIIEGKSNDSIRAIDCFNQAIALRPDYAEAWHNKGLALLDQERHAEAIVLYDQAIQIKPDYAEAYYSRGMSYRALKLLEQALDSFNFAIQHNYPDKGKIEFVLASLTGQKQPVVPPKDFVGELFDDYACKFDSHLVRALKYRAHNILYGYLKELIGNYLDVLDLGCGTGLMGELLKAHAKTLTGIDVSSKMLGEARAKNIYSQLCQSDLNDFLSSNVESYDLITATDVFVYMGDLSGIFSNAHMALKNSGHFCFTVEKLEVGEFCLNPTLRYSHSSEYCEKLAKINNFRIVIGETDVIRQENGIDVLGHYYVLSKT